jgi:hypothetical protein
MPSLTFDKVGFSLVHYESCAMGIGIPPLSLNSQGHCRWNSLCVIILGLQGMSLALGLKDICLFVIILHSAAGGHGIA